MFEASDRAAIAFNRAHAEWLREIAAVDEAEAYRAEGATSVSAWLRGRYGFTKATAVEWARVARRLRDLPAISKAFDRGELCFEQLRPLTRFARAATDERWSRAAPGMSAQELWDEARRHEQVRERDAADVHRNRGVVTWWNDERTEFGFTGRLGAEQGAALENALVDRSEDVVLADEPHDRAGARMADALVELVTESGGTEAAPTLVVHADATVLTGESENPGEAEGGIRFTAQAVRRLACDARIEWMLERDGHAVGLGRRSRFPSARMRRALRFRDRGCVFPGCGRIRWVKAHHIVHWPHGGRTDLDNLVLLCHAHHRLVHEGGWSIRGRPDIGGELRFHDPRGREPFLKQARFTAAEAASCRTASARLAG